MKLIKLFFVLIFPLGFSQQEQDNHIFERLSALNNKGKIWYNIDDYSVTSEVFNSSFDEKGLKKVFKKHKIQDSETKVKDDQITYNNWFVSKELKGSDQLSQTDHLYFVENPDKTTTVIWFIKTGKTDRDTERKLVNTIIENKIPEQNFVPAKITSINFAGRKVELGNSCYWTFLNNVQCPYLGQMNWSIHRTLDDARETVANQLNVTKSRKGGKVESEKIVDIIFEGVPTKAKVVKYDLTGVTSALAGMSGGKSLTVYYIAENIRNKNVSCVMSFWNNDEINPETQLPPLLEGFITLP